MSSNIDFLPRLRGALQRAYAFMSVPSGRPELIKAQYSAFQQQMPLLYFILLTNTWIMVGAFAGKAPHLLTFGMPVALTLLCALRVKSWWQSRQRPLRADWARAELVRTNMLSWMLAGAFCWWAIWLFPYGTVPMQMQIAFFMASTAIGCLFCLSHLRSAAIAVMIIFKMTFVSFFASTGDATFIALAINAVLICAAMFVILLYNYRDFTALVESRRVLQEQQAKTLALSDENFRLANLDSLTDLPNRRSFFSALQKRISSGDAGNTVILGVLDLDGFKPINDTYGHPVGDALLCRLADRIVHVGGEDIQLYRLGGDEFAILFEARDIDQAQLLGSRICQAVREPFAMTACTARISGTMGLASYPDMAGDSSELFERADYAMYRAKRGEGRGEVWVFTEQDEGEIKRGSILETALKGADLEAELSMVFQPIVDIKTSRTVGFEALARWNNPELGRVSPYEFIPSAERAGLIGEVTIVLLRKALAAAETWPSHMRLSFNLSVADIASPENLLRITSIIGQSDISPHRIDLEITETAMVKDFASFMTAVAALKSIGVCISLDDFGTGFSSLRQVHQLPLDKLKVDRSFVTDVDKNLSSQKIIRSLVALCDDLKLDCVIEGVETADELDAIRELGCQLVQGYYYSKPLASDDVRTFLDREGQSRVRAGL